MPTLRISPQRYRWATGLALVLLVFIVVTGALVRLTESGLGCSDWPECNDTSFIDVSSKHAAIEQINRLVTGLVGVGVVAASLGSLMRSPRRRDLTALSLAMLVGVPAQAVVGAFLVWSELNPFWLMCHFLLSMVLLAIAMTLHWRAGQASTRTQMAVRASIARHSVGLAVLIAAVIVTGTVVTGTGPHSGSYEDEPIRRFGFTVLSVVRVHSVLVWTALATALGLMWRVRNRPDERERIGGPLEGFLVLGVVQAGIGLVQYFNDLPIVLVALHVLGATLLWLVTVHLVLSTRQAVTEADAISENDRPAAVHSS